MYVKTEKPKKPALVLVCKKSVKRNMDEKKERKKERGGRRVAEVEK